MKRDMDLIRELLLKLEALPMRRGGIVSIAPDDEEITVPGMIPIKSTTTSVRLAKLGSSMKVARAQWSALVFVASLGPAMIFLIPYAIQRFGRRRKRARRRPRASLSISSEI